MLYVELLPNTTGPSYIYMSRWGTVSYLDHCLGLNIVLDHCLVTNVLHGCIVMYKVHEEQIENNSD